MKREIWQKRIPSLLGIILILLSIGITSFLTKNQTIFNTRASPSNAPLNIRITNISESSFTVSYKTYDKSIGIIKYGKDKNLGNLSENSVADKELTPSYLHYIIVKNLQPETKYFFLIRSNGDDFFNKDALFEITTAPKIEKNDDVSIDLSGKLILPNGDIPDEALVYLVSENSDMVAVLAKKGEYFFSYYLSDFDQKLKILATANLYESEVLIQAEKSQKLPTIVLSKNYDFTLSGLPAASISGEINFPSYSTSSKALKNPEILSPKQEEMFKDLRPLFSGSASPSSEIEVVINSEEEIKSKIKADSRGNWSFRPKEPLSPGKHTLTIKTKDRFGILKTITKSFIIYAQGSQVTETATPSATPKISFSPTLSLPSFTPSPTVILTPTSTPFPTQTIIIPTKPPPPQVGSSQTITLAAVSASIAAFGLFLFLLSRGNISLYK